MARKKYDFKPDRTGTGDFSKLYLTRKQRLSLLKWALFGSVCLVLLVVQDVIFSRLRFFGATTDLMCCAILMICVLEGAESGGVFILIASLVYRFSGSAPGWYSVVLLTFLGIFAAVFRQAYLRKGPGATFFCAGIAMMLYELGIFATGMLLGYTHAGRLGIFCLTGAYSLLAMPILYPILVSIGKIGGETWKE